MTTEFSSFAVLMVTGIFLANMLLVMLSLIPLTFVVMALAHSAPGDIHLSRGKARKVTGINESIHLGTGMEVNDGMGIVVLSDTLPRRLVLEGGSVLRVFWKGRGELKEDMDYSIKCTRGGSHIVGRSRVESFHFSGLVQTIYTSGDRDTEVLVKHSTTDLRDVRDPRLSRRVTMPVNSISRINAPSTDFKEIREYTVGDDFRNINWKATVRTGGLEKDTLLVNDFEREGTRRVWLFMDCGRVMASGPSVRDAYEYALQATLGLARFYLSRECEVGLYMYHHGRYILPDSGHRQESLITNLLLASEMEPDRETLERSVRGMGGHIAGTNPLFIVITRLNAEGARELKDGIRQMRLISGKRSKIVIMHVGGGDEPAASSTERMAERITELRLLPVISELRRSGSRLITWDPAEQDFKELVTSILAGRSS